MSILTVKHSANIGDLIASLAGLHQYWMDNNEQIVYHQQLNVKGIYYDNDHPTKENGDMVMCNKKMFEMIKPLIEDKYSDETKQLNKVINDYPQIKEKINKKFNFSKSGFKGSTACSKTRKLKSKIDNSRLIYRST